MALSKLNHINTGKDGVLDGTSPADVDELVAEMGRHRRVVLHFHGGLVNKKAGMESAERLKRDCYDLTPAHAVFFVWESGLLEVLAHNLGEIAGEEIFKDLAKWLFKFAIGKLQHVVGVKGAALQMPSDMEIYRELARRDKNEEPFDGITPPAGISELSPEERSTFEETLATDTEFQQSVQAIVASVIPQTILTGEKGVVLRMRKSARTLMSPQVIEEIKADAEAAQRQGAKMGIFATAKLIESAATILIRVINRFREGRDHGLYPTVVEDIL